MSASGGAEEGEREGPSRLIFSAYAWSSADRRCGSDSDLLASAGDRKSQCSCYSEESVKIDASKTTYQTPHVILQTPRHGCVSATAVTYDKSEDEST